MSTREVHRPDGSSYADVTDGATTGDPTQPMEPDQSLPDLIGRLSSDFGELVTTQVELAKVEIKEEVAKAGKGAGMLGGGAVAGLLALTLLSFAAAWGLAEVMAEGWAFLIVGAIWAVTAAALFMSGRNRLTTVEPVPETRESIKEDITWAKQQKS
jgi:uncharacterized membrane protein YqjE